MRNWIKEAEDFLHSQYIRTCEILDSNKNPSPMLIAPALEQDEARRFIQGLENGLFTVDEQGYVQSCLLPPSTGKNAKQKMLQLFWAKKNGRGLFREGVCQLATVSALIFEHGWKRYQIMMEPSVAGFGHFAYGVYILIRVPECNLIICGEVKRSQGEFQKLLDGFRYCCQRGPHTKNECAFPKNHPKYEFCLGIRPSYFFATAPGKTTCFMLSYDEDIVCIKNKVDELPSQGRCVPVL